MRKLSLMAVLGAVAAVCCIGSAAQANSILSVAPTTITASGPNFNWTYTVVLTGDSILQSGDYFDIVDFQGFVGFPVAAPAGWTESTVAQTATAGQILLTSDSPSVLDLHFVYNGANVTNSGTNQTTLGTFEATSLYGQSTAGWLAAQDHDSTFGLARNNTDRALVPAVPVPAAAYAGLSMLGGLGLFGAARRRRMA